MRRSVTAEELARLAGVRAATVRKTARELLTLLKQDMEAAEWVRTMAQVEADGQCDGEDPHTRPVQNEPLLAGDRGETTMSRGLLATARIKIEAPPSSVWDALVNPEKIAKYLFGAQVASEWKKGSPIVWKGVWKGAPYQDRGTILEVEEGRHISYSHFSPLSGLADEPENYHTVTVDLRSEGGQTEVVLVQDNNPDDEAKEHSQKNWESMLQGLKQLLETQ